MAERSAGVNAVRARALRRARVLWAVYALLVLASVAVNDVIGTGFRDAPRARASVETPRRVYYDAYGPGEGVPIDPTRMPVLLMHGSPGDAKGFARLGPMLAADGRRVITPDLLGFGMSDDAPDLGYKAQATAMLALLDRLGIRRAHVLGWSNGGGAALWMAHLAPERVASVTLMASVGAQSAEGSGDHAFEHLKYNIGRLALGPGLELVPHFGLLGTPDKRTRWLRNFDDSDQRAIESFMPTITTPTMILHGRHDFLVYDWAAEAHHRMLPTSRLVMLDASHFIPFMQAREAAGYLLPFFERHDTPGVAPETGEIDLSPEPVRHGAALWLHRLAWWLRGVPWIVLIAACALLVRARPTLGVVLAGVVCAVGPVDFGIGGLGVVLGQLWWRTAAGVLDRPRSVIAWVCAVGWAFLAGVLAWSLIGAGVLRLTDRFGIAGLIGGVVCGHVALSVVRLAWTRTGRSRLLGAFARLRRQEYWPMWTHYLPSFVWFFVWFARARGVAVPTAVNPGYARDGGIADERKHEILARMRDPAVLHGRLVEPDADTARRCSAAGAIVDSDGGLGGFPLIAKPDQGERGRAVALVRDRAALDAYIASHTEPVLLQRYHPGPVEVGVLWVRDPKSLTDPGHAGARGRIYAVTAKVMPEVIGDGRRTLRRLILAHPRHRALCAVFIERLRDRLYEVPDAGERVSLGAAGNHAQGAMFTDGSRLITPELESFVDRIASSFEGGFDIGRFDLRCPSDEHLMRGEGIGVIELNGATSEPTNIYDPSWPIWRAQRVLWGYWDRLVDLGIARVKTGTGGAMGWGEAVRVIAHWKIRRKRSGSALGG